MIWTWLKKRCCCIRKNGCENNNHKIDQQGLIESCHNKDKDENILINLLSENICDLKEELKVGFLLKSKLKIVF